jgi:Zn-dependent protease
MQPQEAPAPPPYPSWGPPPEPTLWQKLKKLLAPLGVVLVIALKFLGKLKFIILPAMKFLPTAGTMLLSIGAYAWAWGFWFALGFVLLILVHECGHLLAARRLGLKVGLPVFIPFMGAVIALKEAPRNAWIESQVGIGGPMLGTLGAGVCYLIHLVTGNLLFGGLAFTGFGINLFNLTPVGFLDGGRIVTALSPWVWVAGFLILAAMTVLHPNLLLFIILVASLPRLFFLFRPKSEEQRRYFEVTPRQRWEMALMYFGLIALLVVGMQASYIPRETLQPN